MQACPYPPQRPCRGVLAAIQAKLAKLRAEIAAYNPWTDAVGGFPTFGGGFTKPGGHWVEIIDLQTGILSDWWYYYKNCNGRGGNPPISGLPPKEVFFYPPVFVKPPKKSTPVLVPGPQPGYAPWAPPKPYDPWKDPWTAAAIIIIIIVGGRALGPRPGSPAIPPAPVPRLAY
jgi:hypothetical protein